MFDTIAAISTPPGESAIGIIRISGPIAHDVACRILINYSRNKILQIEPRTVNRGFCINPYSSEILDEVLWFGMKAPNSYTGEDMIEINCHGGQGILRIILDLAVRVGCRLAEPGEFTKRAFLNGKLDLSQAEAVCDLIQAKSLAGVKKAMRQLEGELGSRLELLSENLMELVVELEARLNFPEDILEDTERHEVNERVFAFRSDVKNLLKLSGNKKLLMEEIRTPLVGLTNVGKSSLMNRLLGKERVLVSETPGTTRDYIEERLSLGELQLTLIDMAGIRSAQDILEAAGIRKGQQQTEAADLLICLLESHTPLSSEEKKMIENLPDTPVIVVLNKCDLGQNTSKIEQLQYFKVCPICVISAKTGEGLEGLKETLATKAAEISGANIDGLTVYDIRHQDLLRKAALALERAQEGLETGQTDELLCFDLREAQQAIDNILGKQLNDDILNSIFNRFCIGK